MSDDDLLTIYENESYIGGVEGAHAGLRAVFDAGRDSRPADGVWIDAGKAREVGVCIWCSGTEASCARSRIKCCPDCTHRDSRPTHE